MTQRSTPAKSHSPSHSCRLWLDHDAHGREAIFVELASGLITKFDAVEGGLSKVIKLLRKERPITSNGTHNKESLPINPRRRRHKLPDPNPEGTARATDFLKKIGVLK